VSPESPALAVRRAWARNLARALPRIRLNRHFPPWRSLAGHLELLAEREPSWDDSSGLPDASTWMKLLAERDLAPEQLARWSVSDADTPELAARVAERRTRLEALVAVPKLPVRDIQVKLRHREGPLASYAVTVDRFDPQTVTLARYSMILSDEPGEQVSEGELELVAAEHFHEALLGLSTQDAALAFAVLQEKVAEVEEVVRGVVGPAWMRDADGRTWGPDALDDLPVTGPIFSACLERVSLDVSDVVVDDPLATSIVMPSHGQRFGMARRRKWAAPRSDVAALRAWLGDHDSRNLVYPYTPAP
jgi:hypothetical protein